MKAKHILFLIVLYMVFQYYRRKSTVTTPLAITNSETAREAILRRDMQELIEKLESRIEGLEGSPYA